jgi:DNA-directed RNA polymerase specialized sigma24 family protein
VDAVHDAAGHRGRYRCRWGNPAALFRKALYRRCIRDHGCICDLETFYRRTKADLVFWVRAGSSISFEEAEDVVQEAFARALRQVQAKPISNPEAWFKKVTRQIIADTHPKPAAHRKRRVRETLTDPAELPERRWDRAKGILPAEWLEMNEEARLAADEISALSGKPRAVMAEYYKRGAT